MKTFQNSVQDQLILTSPEQIKQFINESLSDKFEDYKAQDDLMDMSEAAEFLGISKKTLYLKTSKREIPFHRPKGTKKIWFSKEHLTEWIKSYGGE